MSRTTAELEELAQAYAATTALRLRWAVHNEDGAEIADLIETLDMQELRTLVVVLAAQASRPRSRPDDGVVDEIAIARALTGERVQLTHAERIAAVKILRLRGHSKADIARCLHMSVDTLKTLLAKVA